MASPSVAARTELSAPQVREWLRAQAAGGYLTYDPTTEAFTLPEAVAVAMLPAPRTHAAWGELGRRARDCLEPSNVFRRSGSIWRFAFDGREAHLPDSKGLHDIATLVAAPDQDVHMLVRPAAAETATVILHTQFEPLDPAATAEVSAMIEGAFQQSLEALRRFVEQGLRWAQQDPASG